MSVLGALSVPAGWRSVPFGRVTTRTKEVGRPDLPPLSVFLGAGVVPRSSREDNHNQLGEDLGKYLVVRPGDLVFNKLRTWQGGLGASAHEGIVSPAYFVCRPSPGYDSRFLQYLLLSDAYLQELTRVSKWQPPSQFDIGWEQLRAVPVVAPPVTEQRAIADYLDTETARIDALIAKKQRMIELSNLRWRRQLLDAVAPHLVGASVPEGWLEGRLRNLVDRVVGGSWGVEPGETSVDAPCVRAADFNFPRLTAEGGAIRSYGLSEMQSRVVCPGDLVIEKSGGGAEAPVGRVVMWLGEDNAVPTNFAARLRPTDAHDSWFVLLAFRAAYEAGLNWRSIKQTTGIQNLDTGAYLSEPWPIPPIDVQRRVASDLRVRLDSAMTLRDVLQRQISLLREHRQASITAAVTGQLEVPGVAA